MCVALTITLMMHWEAVLCKTVGCTDDGKKNFFLLHELAGRAKLRWAVTVRLEMINLSTPKAMNHAAVTFMTYFASINAALFRLIVQRFFSRIISALKLFCQRFSISFPPRSSTEPRYDFSAVDKIWLIMNIMPSRNNEAQRKTNKTF